MSQRPFALIAALIGLTATATAQTPDVIVFDIGFNGTDQNDIVYWGTNIPGTLAAYNFATQSCNSGTAPLDWFDSGGDTRHPVIGQNMFRIKDGRIQHIGQSWLKHGFCAVNEQEGACGSCQGTDCNTLGIGCADTYWATLNDGRGGESKRFVNATTGTHTDTSTPGPTGGSTMRGRLQVRIEHIDPSQNPDAEWVIEGQYITADDTLVGNGDNNASWRRIEVNAVSNIQGGGPTHREEPAIYAWKHFDPEVEIQRIDNVEGAFTTQYYLGYRVTRLAPRRWQYEYALQNMTSDQSANSVSIPYHPTATITNTGFFGSRYHSSDPYDQTPWPAVDSGNTIDWATDSFNTNPDAYALRWGTLYNYYFEANTPPEDGQVTIGLFKPGTNSSIVVMNVPVPSELIVQDELGQAPTPPATGPTITLPQTLVRNGSGNNALALQESAPANLGEEWQGVLPAGEEGLLLIGRGGPTEGLYNGMGEVLVLPPYRTMSLTDDLFRFRVPRNADLVGDTIHVQGLVHTDEGWRLTNALDVVVGQ